MSVPAASDSNIVHLSARLGTSTPEGAEPVSLADMKARVSAVVEIAKRHAADVDATATFPHHTFQAIKQHRLLGLLVPEQLGGEGADIGLIADICYKLAQACSSSAMILAMHYVKVGCILHHHKDSAWHKNLLRRLASEQLLFASSTTEGQAGGNIRSSAAPIEYDGEIISLTRTASVISYGQYADAIVTTARRTADAPSSDQVLAIFMKEDYTLEPLSDWNALGMRGTCSSGYTLKAQGSITQLMPESYDKIHSQAMVPYAHILWSSAWAGIASAATERAQRFIRHAARNSQGQLPPGAAHLTRARTSLNTLRALIASTLKQFKAAQQDERTLTSIDFQTAITLTKVEASELATSIVMNAYRATGIAGYRNDGDFSIGRYLRDILSAPIMINNDRILSNIATAALMGSIPDSITD